MRKVTWAVSVKGARYVTQRTPVVVAQRVFLTFNHGAGDVPRGTLLCVDIESGSELWRFDVDRVLNTPVVDDAAIYVTSMAGVVYKLDFFGKLVWKATPTTGRGTWKPVLCGNVLVYAEISGGAKRTWGVSKGDGSVIWSYESGGHAYSLATTTHVVVHSSVTGGFGQYAIDLHCIRAADGALVWKMSHSTHLFTPAIVADRIFIGSRGHVLCVSLTTGQVVAEYNLPAGIAAVQAPLVTPAGIVFCAENGSIFSLSMAVEEQGGTQETASAFEVNWTVDAGGHINTAPILDNDRFHVISEAGSIVTFALHDGTQIIKTPIPRFKQGFGMSIIGNDVVVSASREAIRMTLQNLGFC